MIVRYVQPLTQEQRQLLETTMKDAPTFRARSRAHGLLLSAHGTTIKDIAKTYQVHRVTVSAWIKSSTLKVRGGIISQANRSLGGFCSSQSIFPPHIIQVLLKLATSSIHEFSC
jgi:Homeodomain-like domain